jgi:uncharacterized membrane protein
MSAGQFLYPEMRRGLSLVALAGFVVATLFLAGAIHITTILLVPEVAGSDGWSRLAQFAGEGKFVEVPTDGSNAAGVTGLDPLFLNGACGIDVGDNPAAISLDAGGLFWSLALYDPQGTITFSLNDRTASEGQMRMLVATPEQNAELKQASQPADDQTIVVETQSDELIALLRVFAPTASARRSAGRVLEQAGCARAPIDAGDSTSGG